MTHYTVTMLGKTIDIRLSDNAARELARRTQPLYLEMELYFSCLLRKRVNVLDHHNSEFTAPVNDTLELAFRPVMTRACSVASLNGAAPPVGDFPIQKPENYVPHWLTLDYRKGEWSGEFGYRTHIQPDTARAQPAQLITE